MSSLQKILCFQDFQRILLKDRNRQRSAVKSLFTNRQYQAERAPANRSGKSAGGVKEADLSW